MVFSTSPRHEFISASWLLPTEAAPELFFMDVGRVWGRARIRAEGSSCTTTPFTLHYLRLAHCELHFRGTSGSAWELAYSRVAVLNSAANHIGHSGPLNAYV